MYIRYHPQFKKSYRDLPPDVKRKAETREIVFRKNLFDPRLKTHKLHGKLKHLWSFSIKLIARKIVEAHSGETLRRNSGQVWAESEGEGKGSRFFVKLRKI